ncbi:MAG TPA: hypothetical protein VLK53_01185 [Gaiellaceae bacterium]|nr:hypothetical protein [Gaiellaceae bacterium]
MHLIATLAIAAGGLHGIVMKGPTQPVCRVGQPCSAPAQVTLVFRRTGPAPRIFRTRSTTAGAYRIALPAGYYAVTTAEKIGITPNIRPQRVHVRAGHQDALNFRIDTGIR